jgi:glycosyltransferase involved in cell wall biosynthesis
LKLPKISLVTPSFNQGSFLEETIRSVLAQNYPDLEYIVIDGGSCDKSVEIIRRHQPQLAYWVSEPDQGQYDAINKGFARSSGEVMGWLNSDDKLLPWALETVGEIFASFPKVEWVTSLFPFGWDERGRPAICNKVEGYTREGFMAGINLPGGDWLAEDFIQQESTFWRRSLWEKAGGKIDPGFRYAGDFDLWARFFATGAEVIGVPLPLGGFRFHGGQKTAVAKEGYFKEAYEALLKHRGKPLSGMRELLAKKYRKLEHSAHKRYLRTVRKRSNAPVFVRDPRKGWELREK